jgi:single-stranded-DNA-specific exonuclease
LKRTRWVARQTPFPQADAPDPGSPAGIPASLAAVLARRGLTGERLAAYLNPDMVRMEHWSKLPGASEAVEVIAEAVRSGRRIVVHGDFDADGITATALTCTALARLGSEAAFHIPDRFSDGYGLGDSGVAACRELGAELVVTVDCGITAVEPIRVLHGMGIRTVITDHHQPDGQLPEADAIASPVLGEPDSPHSDLSGAGTAWLVMKGVAERLGRAGAVDDLLQLAALGTVCDVVSLTGTNRLLVAAGLDSIRSGPLPGMAALASSAAVEVSAMTSRHLAFQLGPRLNACGRVGHSSPAVALMMARDPGEAASLAREIAASDRERRSLDSAVRTESEAMAARFEEPRCLVLWKQGWHRGVIGISASRLAERYGAPALLFSIKDGTAHGSARSVPGISIHALLGRVQEDTGMLHRFGGHPMAAGLSLPSSRLPELAELLQAHLADSSFDRLLGPVLCVDGRLEEADFCLPTVHALRKLEPFGHGNEEPVWLARGVWPLTWRAVGKGKEHLSCTFRIGGKEVRAIGFGLAGRQSLFGARVDLAFTIAEDSWRADGGVQLLLRDVRKSSNGTDQ